MTRVYRWHLWPGRHWPASRAEEADFAAALAAARPPARDCDRGDVTAVLNALRCGIGLDELRVLVPGVDVARLHVAYRRLDDRRVAALAAWDALCADPGGVAVSRLAQQAATLLPVPVYRLVRSPRLSGSDGLAGAVADATAAMARVGAQVEAVEARLASLRVPSPEGVELGRVLYDPYTPGLWAHPYYRPTRVGTLMPLRVRDLLGEARL